MKKSIKILLLTMLTMLVSMTFVFLTGCKDKNVVKYAFDTQGGNAIASVEVEEGSEYTLPIPQREGYSFEGWYTNADFEGDPVEKVVASGDATYYAKWEKLYALHLELNGGSLSATTLYLKAGQNVYDFLQDYVPTKDGVVFGAWFNGENELSRNTRMPEAELTLAAKYKVAYTVEFWGQNLTLDAYVKVADDVIGYEYPGVEFTSEQTLTGFQEIAHANTVNKKTIVENSSENVFKHYFDRQEFTVRFDPNYPNESTGTVESVKVVFGTEVTVLDSYKAEGYVLLGWATSTAGELVYKTNYLQSETYNKDAAAAVAVPDKFVPERNVTLYGVWEKGYTDMFGGSDYLYLLTEGEETSIYLSRGDKIFKGVYRTETGRFYFQNGDEILEGQLNQNKTYSYRNTVRGGTSCTLLVAGVGLDANTTLYFDAYNGLTYSVADAEGKTTNSEGSYLKDENGYYTATFTSGPLADQTLIFMTGYASDGTPAFQVRNEEEFAIGTLVQFGVIPQGESQGAIGWIQSGAYNLTLDGFSTATYVDVSNSGMTEVTYGYVKIGDNITLIDRATSSVFKVARIMEINGMKGYMFYDSEWDTEFVFAGAKLKMDGTHNATITKDDGTTITGTYIGEESIFGGTIITVYGSNSQMYKYVITQETVELEGQTILYYTVENKDPGYAEYYRMGANNVRPPVLVVNEPSANKATLYDYTTEGTYVMVSIGDISQDDTTGLYTYTAQEYTEEAYEPYFEDAIADLMTVKTLVLALDSETTIYNLYYWYSWAGEEGTATPLTKTYTDPVSGGTLMLYETSGIAIYSAGGNVYTCIYSTADGVTALITPDGYVYVELNAENGTYVTLDVAPYTANMMTPDGTENKDIYLVFDGKGGATYTVVTKEGENDPVTTEYVGTVTRSDSEVTSAGFYIFTFTYVDPDDAANNITFKFIQKPTANGNAIVFSTYNESYNGTYSAEAGILTLDGYGGNATYLDSDGVTHTGSYSIPEENVVLAILDEAYYYYFDLKANRAFTVRGAEYGTYFYVDNQALMEYYFDFDGYGRLTVYFYDENDERVDITTEGTYVLDDTNATLRYTDGAKEITLEGALAAYSYGGYAIPVFIKSYEHVVQTYINEADWSVLILDSLGNATKHSKDGAREYGAYTIITDDLFYYVNNAASDASIYRYDAANGTVTQLTFDAVGYYTESLESLLFSQYGFAFFNSQDYYYYNIEDGNVIIYKQDPTAENANKYGFVIDTEFGGFDAVKDYGGKTYYINSGYAITFNRAVNGTENNYPIKISADSEKYPLEGLTFTPAGTAEFSVLGQVQINGKNYACIVTREVDEEGNATLYVTNNYFRFDISITYNGSGNNTYEVTALRWIQEAPNYTYMYMWYQIASWLGEELANAWVSNTIGTITVVDEYNALGEVTNSYVTCEFGTGSGMYDANGKLFETIETTYTLLDSGIYMVEVKGEDEYDYNLYFILNTQVFGSPVYQLIAFTREETLETEDKTYKVEAEMIVASDGYGKGYYSAVSQAVTLFCNDTKVEADYLFLKNDIVYYVERTKDETTGKITATNYYAINLVEDAGDGLTEPDENVVPPHKSVTVTKEEMQVRYSAEGSSYVDIGADGVMMLCIGDEVLIVVSCEYDEATKTYTLTASNQKSYTVEVKEDGTVDIDEVLNQPQA